jgi:hypothetical protein
MKIKLVESSESRCLPIGVHDLTPGHVYWNSSIGVCLFTEDGLVNIADGRRRGYQVSDTFANVNAILEYTIHTDGTISSQSEAKSA